MSFADYQLFSSNSRGTWWDRLALDLDVHLKEKDKAMSTVTAGLDDPLIGDKDRLLLQVLFYRIKSNNAIIKASSQRDP